ncbi:DUF7490 domain-containing protein [Halopiger goleimassiliensis]|uniref:DUF7490 domain-containing protein n=1 Tax=Halopiger goleimassiliensis TaxID=1293048 RepID=UPI0006777FDD|nr:hypothetical protein [Halopiger goleimassiliensis]
MNREYALAIAALLVVVAAGSTLVLGGAIDTPAEPETEASVDGYASLVEVTIAAEEASGETVTLAVDSYLEGRDGPVENVTVVHRATDTDSNLVEETTEHAVGTVAAGTETVAEGTADHASAEPDLESTDTDAGGTTGSSSTRAAGPDLPEDVRTYVAWGGLAICSLFAIFAVSQLYGSVTEAIHIWVEPRHQPLIEAAFNLVVLLGSLIGISLGVRELS